MGRSMKSTARHIPGPYVDLKGVISLLGEPVRVFTKDDRIFFPTRDIVKVFGYSTNHRDKGNNTSASVNPPELYVFNDPTRSIALMKYFSENVYLSNEIRKRAEDLGSWIAEVKEGAVKEGIMAEEEKEERPAEEPAETVEETGAEEEPAEDSSHPLQIAFGIDDVVLSRASFDKLVEGISLAAEALQEARNAVE